MELSAIIERGMEVAARNERPDLRSRLGQTLARLRDPNVRVMVVGEFKQGKSQLVNALVGAPVCPVDDDVATSVPTTVRYGAEPSATMLVPARRDPGDTASAADLVRTPVPLEEVASLVSEHGNPGNVRGISSVDVQLPRTLLAGGLALVDSPGVGGLDAVHALATLATLPTAHALLLVTDASQEFTEPEMRFIRQAVRVCPNVAVVMTKIDLYPRWREIADLNRGHLDRAGLEAASLFPVSSSMRIMAAQHGDAALNDDSGFPALVRHLRNDIVGRAAEVVRRATAHDLRSTSEHIALSLSAELSAIERPESAPELVARLERARERSEDLRKEASRWQTTLNDGVADLLSDLEYDLRDRLRRVRRDAEVAIDEGDPGADWEQFVSWLEQRIAAAVSDTFVWTDERSSWLSEQVATHFEDEAVALPAVRVDDTDGVLDPVERPDELDRGKLSFLEASFVTLRGTYGGVLMIGLVTSLAGLSLINPISLAAGVLLAGKAYRDDKQARLQRRQAEAKMIVRRHIDDVVFQVGKQLKDRLRLVHRATRDHFIDVAEEYHRSIADSVTAAQTAVDRDVRESKQRAREIRAELERVEWLSRAADKVEPSGDAAGRSPVSATPAGARRAAATAAGATRA